MRVLLIEDDQDVRLLVQNVLNAAGCHVNSVSDKASALALLGTLSYDLILIDDRLPDGLGIEIAEYARECGIDLVAITGFW